MRLAILDHGHGIRTKAMFMLIRVFSGHPVVDAVKLALYRPSFYRGGGLTQEAMRGPSDWSVADRELMAAFVSKVNNTEFCIAAHTATSALAYKDGAKVSAALADTANPPAPRLKCSAEARRTGPRRCRQLVIRGRLGSRAGQPPQLSHDAPRPDPGETHQRRTPRQRAPSPGRPARRLPRPPRRGVAE